MLNYMLVTGVIILMVSIPVVSMAKDIEDNLKIDPFEIDWLQKKVIFYSFGLLFGAFMVISSIILKLFW